MDSCAAHCSIPETTILNRSLRKRKNRLDHVPFRRQPSQKEHDLESSQRESELSTQLHSGFDIVDGRGIMEGMDMSGMSAANVNNLTVAVMNSSSSLTMSASTTAQQCSPMLEGFQFAFGSLSSGSSSSPCILYLFPGANVDTPFKYAVAVLFTCFAAMGYELLRARREELVASVKATTNFSLQAPSQTSSSLPDYDALIAILYTIQTMLGYFLMMLVMTFDITLFVAISVGFGMGYYWVLRNQRALAMRKEPVANYKLMVTPTSASSGTSTTIATTAFTTTPLPTITSAEAC